MHEWVARLVEMDARMPVRGGIAAAHLAAAQADAQMHPPSTDLQALLASVDVLASRRAHRDLVEVSARYFGHVCSQR